MLANHPITATQTEIKAFSEWMTAKRRRVGLSIFQKWLPSESTYPRQVWLYFAQSLIHLLNFYLTFQLMDGHRTVLLTNTIARLFAYTNLAYGIWYRNPLALQYLNLSEFDHVFIMFVSLSSIWTLHSYYVCD